MQQARGWGGASTLTLLIETDSCLHCCTALKETALGKKTTLGTTNTFTICYLLRVSDGSSAVQLAARLQKSCPESFQVTASEQISNLSAGAGGKEGVPIQRVEQGSFQLCQCSHVQISAGSGPLGGVWSQHPPGRYKAGGPWTPKGAAPRLGGALLLGPALGQQVESNTQLLPYQFPIQSTRKPSRTATSVSTLCNVHGTWEL